MLALSFALPSHDGNAVGLGGYEVQSSLGQRLRMIVQVSARSDETVEPGCFKINPFVVASDGLPQLTTGVIALERSNGGQRLLISSARPINDPIVRISIDVGCDTTLRRDLTLLLDPAPVIENLAEATAPDRPAPATATQPSPQASGEAMGGAPGSAPGAASAATSQPDSATPLTAAPGTGTARAPTRRPPASSQASPPPRVAARPPAQPRASSPPQSIPPRQSSASVQPPLRDAEGLNLRPSRQAPKTVEQHDRLTISSSGPPLSASSGAPLTPRLTLSTSLSDRKGQQPLPDSVLGMLRQKQARLKAAPSEEDIPSLEAEIVVLQKRTAELRTQLDSMVAQMQALGGAPKVPTGATGVTAAPDPAGITSAIPPTPVAALPAPPPESSTSWLDTRWLLAAGLALFIAVMAAALLAWVRRERAERRRAERWNQSPYVPTTTPKPPANPDTVSTIVDAARPMPSSTLDFPPEPKHDRTPMPESYAFTSLSTGHAARELGVSDLAQATEKAGVFMTLGRPEQAIDTLRDHVDHEANSSPMAWLMLLDLYRQTGRRDDFAEVSERFHQTFNSETAQWEAHGSDDPGLAAFPRILGKIHREWPLPEARDYIDELLYDNRGGSRIGFSLTAFRDLLLLRNIVDDYLGDLANPPRTDPQTGALLPPVAPSPPSHLAAAWTAVAQQRHAQAELRPALELDLDKLSDSKNASALEEEFPIIAEAIVHRWGRPGLGDYLTTILSANKDGRDISNDVLNELLLLQDVAYELEETVSRDTI